MAGTIKASEILDIKDLASQIEKVSKATGLWNQELEELTRTIVEGTGAFDKRAGSQEDLQKQIQQGIIVSKKLQTVEKSRLAVTKEVVKAQELEKKRVKELRDEVKKEIGVKKQNISFTDKLTKSFQNAILKVTALTGVAIGLFKSLQKGVQHIREVNKQVSKTAASFDITRENASKLTKQIRGVAEAFGRDFNDVLKSSNILSKEFGISGSEAVNLINEGFEKGADINGEYLELLKEYPAQLKTVGLSARQTIAIITQTEQAGLFSDKGIDAIKEAGIRLRELTPATEAALNNIGLAANEIQTQLASGEKTLFEITQQVSAKMAELPPQSKEVGTAIADIFGGPGEDVGLRFLTTLKDIDLELDNIDSTLSDVEKSSAELTKAWAGFRDEVASGEGLFSDALNFLQSRVGESINMLRLLNKPLEEQKAILNALEVDLENKLPKIKELILANTQLTLEQQTEALEKSLVRIGLFQNTATILAQQFYDEQVAIAQQAEEKITAEQLRQQELRQAEQELRQAEQLKIDEELAEERRKAFQEALARRNAEELAKDQELIAQKTALSEEYLNEEKARYLQYLEEKYQEEEKRRQEEIERQKNKEEAIKDIKIASVEAAGEIVGNILSNNINTELAEFEASQEAKKTTLENRLDKGLISEEAYQEKIQELERQSRIESAKAAKKKAVLEATLQAAVAIISQLVATPLPAGLPFVYAAGALGALQIGIAASTPIPEFKHGTQYSPEGVALVGEGNKSELIATPDGARYLTQKEGYVNLPEGSKVFPNYSKETQEALKDRFDYDKMGQAVAKYAPKNNETQSITRVGAETITHIGSTRINQVNKYLSRK